MPAPTVSAGVVHTVPADVLKLLEEDWDILALWEDLTPLARNEWLCWVEDAKLAATRQRRIERLSTDLQAGKRRPCCWPGCTHRARIGKP